MLCGLRVSLRRGTVLAHACRSAGGKGGQGLRMYSQPAPHARSRQTTLAFSISILKHVFADMLSTRFAYDAIDIHQHHHEVGGCHDQHPPLQTSEKTQMCPDGSTGGELSPKPQCAHSLISWLTSDADTRNSHGRGVRRYISPRPCPMPRGMQRYCASHPKNKDRRIKNR